MPRSGEKRDLTKDGLNNLSSQALWKPGIQRFLFSQLLDSGVRRNDIKRIIQAFPNTYSSIIQSYYRSRMASCSP